MSAGSLQDIPDWLKNKMKEISAPQMVGAEGSNPMFTYTKQPSITTQPWADEILRGEYSGATPRIVGESKEMDLWEKELDREWLSEAFQSAMPGERDLPTRPSAPSGSGQPGPGSFETLFSMGDPLKKKRRSLEEIGRTA
jgi:hypothetical protein